MRAPPDRPPPRSFWLLVVLILLLGAGLRFASAARTPMTADEATHLSWAHQIIQGHPFTGLHENKWLYSAVLAAFQPTGPEGLWLARVLSALFGVTTTAACIALGRALDGRAAGLISGLVYATLPLAVFHERQALTEPQMAAFTTISTLLVFRLARKPRIGWVLALSLTLALAYLTKMLAITYLSLPVLGALILARRDQEGRRALALSVLSTALAVALIVPVYRLAAAGGVVAGERFRPGLENTLLGQLFSPAMAASLHADLAVILDAATCYTGWVVIALVVLAGAWALLGERRRAVAFLALPGLAFGIVPLISKTTGVDILPPRYYLPNGAPLVVLAALGLRVGAGRLATWRRGAALIAVGALLAAILGPALWFDATLIHEPRQARLARIDRDVQYRLFFDGDLTPLVEQILADWRADQVSQVRVLGYGLEVSLINNYLGPRSGLAAHADRTARAELADWLGAGDQVYWLGGCNEGDEGAERIPPEGARLELVENYYALSGTIALYRITGAEGALADAVTGRAVPEPEEMTGDHAALAAALTSGPEPDVVLVFPSSHAPALAANAGRPVVPLAVGRWPLDVTSAEATLEALNLGTDGDRVAVVLVDEAHSDPARALALALDHHLYRVSEAWYGLLHHQTYLTGPSDPPLTPVGAQFEGAITLEAVALLDRHARPGAAVRVALVWRSAASVQDSYHVFAHLVDAGGTLWAQHDGVPGGGLYPMTTWQPGEPITDRFAILLPPDLPPGDYRLWVGIYHPASRLRLPVTAGEDAGPDYALAGQVEVTAGQ